MKKKVLSILFTVILSFSCTNIIFAASIDEQVEIEESKTLTSSSLPKAYRSDTQEWAKYIGVKNQFQTGLCWAFSTATAAEYSYAKEKYEETGEVYNVKELSSGQLGYFNYNRETDPLNNTEGDLNLLPNYGAYGDWISSGSNHVYTMQTLANWIGLASDYSAPTKSVLDVTTWEGNWNGKTLPYAKDKAYDDELILENGIYYGEADNNTIKQLILKYGAVCTSMYMNDSSDYYFNDNRDAYYVYSGGYPNHAVTIIGWDDNYSKYNFTHEIEGYNPSYSKQLTTPAGNGAWIIQNSWGLDHNGTGKFYISYYSKDAPFYGLFAYDMQPASNYEYNFQYDGTSDCGDSSDSGNEQFYTRKNTKAANLYTNTTEKTLSIDAVGFTTFNEEKRNYTVQVYTNLKDKSNPESGTLVNTTNFSTDTAGVKTNKLSNSVTVEPNETFSIVFTFKEDNYFGVEKERYRNGFPFEVDLEKNQSYFCSANSNSWTDMYNYDACFRIKALANSTSLVEPPKELTKEQQPQAKELYYNGQKQTLISAPTSIPQGYTIYYAAVKMGEDSPSIHKYSTALPAQTEQDIYSIYYFLKGDSTHLDSKLTVFNVEIKEPKQQQPISSTSFVVRINTDELNVRTGPGVNYPVVTALKEGGAYTIVEEQNGWGLLKAYQKNRNGWINLSYTKRK